MEMDDNLWKKSRTIIIENTEKNLMLNSSHASPLLLALLDSYD